MIRKIHISLNFVFQYTNFILTSFKNWLGRSYCDFASLTGLEIILNDILTTPLATSFVLTLYLSLWQQRRRWHVHWVLFDLVYVTLGIQSLDPQSSSSMVTRHRTRSQKKNCETSSTTLLSLSVTFSLKYKGVGSKSYLLSSIFLSEV